MDDWFSLIAAGCELPANSVKELDDAGFVVVSGPVAAPHVLNIESQLPVPARL